MFRLDLTVWHSPIEFPGLGNVSIELPGVVTVGRKEIPDDNHPFRAPGPTDQRGGCPGLNSEFIASRIFRIAGLNSHSSSGELRLHRSLRRHHCDRIAVGSARNAWYDSTHPNMFSSLRRYEGLAPDLAAALVGLTAISALDFSSLKLSIGNADARTNGPLSGILGQVRHSLITLSFRSYNV